MSQTKFSSRLILITSNFTPSIQNTHRWKVHYKYVRGWSRRTAFYLPERDTSGVFGSGATGIHFAGIQNFLHCILAGLLCFPILIKVMIFGCNHIRLVVNLNKIENFDLNVGCRCCSPLYSEPFIFWTRACASFALMIRLRFSTCIAFVVVLAEPCNANKRLNCFWCKYLSFQIKLSEMTITRWP